MRWFSQRDIVVAYWSFSVGILVVVLVLAVGQKLAGEGESVFYLFSGLLLGAMLKRVW
ncbi:hypothetical protein LCGC14_1579380 [marine sediment metagenome]|uniref:Uncharacterized protein n=1 Tax=marine sediment metagenome TaxID=412755 RepID=A0A0F9LHJ7_9ZZZZ